MDKVDAIVGKILSRKAIEDEWDPTRPLHTVLMGLPDHINQVLLGSAARRALVMTQEYGIEGDTRFSPLLDFYYVRESDLLRMRRSSGNRDIQIKILGALTDTCAVLALTRESVRIGGYRLNLHRMLSELKNI